MNESELELKRKNVVAAIRAGQNAAVKANELLEVSAMAVKMRSEAAVAMEQAEKWETVASMSCDRYIAAINAQKAWEQVEAGEKV